MLLGSPTWSLSLFPFSLFILSLPSKKKSLFHFSEKKKSKNKTPGICKKLCRSVPFFNDEAFVAKKNKIKKEVLSAASGGGLCVFYFGAAGAGLFLHSSFSNLKK